jgi:hypothetical protein
VEKMEEAIEANKGTDLDLDTLINNPKAYAYTTTEFGSKKYFIDLSTNNTLAILSLTSGGRTVNERPEEIYTENEADFDFVQAYGNLLVKKSFPIGRPRVITNS